MSIKMVAEDGAHGIRVPSGFVERGEHHYGPLQTLRLVNRGDEDRVAIYGNSLAGCTWRSLRTSGRQGMALRSEMHSTKLPAISPRREIEQHGDVPVTFNDIVSGQESDQVRHLASFVVRVGAQYRDDRWVIGLPFRLVRRDWLMVLITRPAARPVLAFRS